MAIQKIHESFLYAAMAAEDLSAKVNFLGLIDATGKIALATAGTMGFPIYEGAIADKPATIQIGCIGKATAGAAFNAGVLLASDANGKLVTAGSGVAVVGISLAVSGGDGEVVPFIIAPSPTP